MGFPWFVCDAGIVPSWWVTHVCTFLPTVTEIDVCENVPPKLAILDTSSCSVVESDRALVFRVCYLASDLTEIGLEVFDALCHLVF